MIFKTNNNHGIFSLTLNCANCLSDCHPHVGCNATGDREEEGHDEDPKEEQDVKVGLVDKAKNGLGQKCIIKFKETFDFDEILQAP